MLAIKHTLILEIFSVEIELWGGYGTLEDIYGLLQTVALAIDPVIWWTGCYAGLQNSSPNNYGMVSYMTKS